ncbi:MAG: glycosyltransferase family 39 protein [Deltaproteobacteria bacterium]|jgi:4-amino-4-deoxy-L-arabinose transferase-like glycosyltransferase|nr:glycosyltransferase family 39 protein [Deltaproteobacteria bacterium]MDA8307128.1 glycosyltransferase family 39 protein [Deltaproteobacteria bacterium]
MLQNEPPHASASGSSLPKYFFLILICLLFYIPGLFTIPPMDRDEARFAQASKQMVQSHDYVRISFQKKPRDKKPIGIYWLQTASVELSGTAGTRKIWPYRIPSLLGALFAVLLTFAMGKRLFGERTGFLAAILLSSSFLLVVEAHIATTDAVLLVTIMTSQFALSRFYLREDKSKPAGIGPFLAFWLAQAAGILVKGPVTPAIGLLTIVCLTAVDRDTQWLKGLRPLYGLALLAILVSPWMIAIGIDTKGAFFRRSLLGDFLSKVVSGQESHGFPPGFYLAILPLTLWPASSLAGAAVYRAWKSRSAAALRFCLAWILPAWVVFELVPTKLPEYVLPLYPALCFLIAHIIISGEEGKAPELDSKLVRTGYVACQLVILLLGSVCLVLPWFLEHRFVPLALAPAAAAAGGAFFSTRYYFRRRYLRATAIAITATVLTLGPALQWIMPGLTPIWLSRSVSEAAIKIGGKNVKLCSVGYYEPSLIFLAGTKTLLTSAEGAARFLRKNPGGLALVDRRQDGSFLRLADNLGLHLQQVDAFSGINYSKGRHMLLRLYATEADSGKGASGKR